MRRWIALGIAVIFLGIAAPFAWRSQAALRWRAARLAAQARAAVTAHQADHARRLFRDALRLEPDDVAARRDLAALELSLDHWELALLELQTVAELQPEDADAFVALAGLQLQHGWHEAPEAALDKALELSPGRADARRMRANIRLQLGRYAGAGADAKAASDAALLATTSAILRGAEPPAKAAPRQQRIDGRTAGNALGVWTPGQWPGRMGEVREQLDAALEKQDFAAAQKLVDTGYQLSPGGAFGPFLAGVVELAHGTAEAAEKDFTEARLAAPRFPAAVAALGRVWSKQGGAANAGQKLMQLAEREPRLAPARYLAARAFVEAGDPVKAEAALRRGLQLQPDSPVPYRQLTDYYFGLDRVPEALESCRQGVDRFPNDVGLRMMLAQIDVALGKADDAAGVYQAVAAGHPDLDIVQYRLATLLAQKPDRAPFLEILQRLEADQPADPLQADALGWLFFRGGNLPRARKLLESAVQEVPDEPGPRFHLAAVCARQGELPRARQELQTALESPRPFPERLDAMRLLRESGAVQR